MFTLSLSNVVSLVSGIYKVRINNGSSLKLNVAIYSNIL